MCRKKADTQAFQTSDTDPNPEMSVNRRCATVGDAVVKTARQERTLKDADAEQHGQNCGGQGDNCLGTTRLAFGKRTNQAEMTIDRSVTMQRLMQGVADGQNRGDEQQQGHKTG